MAIRIAQKSEKPTVRFERTVAPKTQKPADIGIPITEKPSRKGAGGRPRKPDALVAVTLRLHPDVIAAFQAGGDDWRARMAEALRLASL